MIKKIPVLDLKDGQAVSGKSGHCKQYLLHHPVLLKLHRV